MRRLWRWLKRNSRDLLIFGFLILAAANFRDTAEFTLYFVFAVMFMVFEMNDRQREKIEKR